MKTSLQAISNKARRVKKHRFQNLCSCLTVEFLIDTWRYINKKSAPGIDEVDAKEYEKNLRENVEDLVKRLKEKRYSAKLIKRVYIPKENGKLRPLGLPSIEDKLLQTAVSRLLTAIYEEDFLSCSFGYRKKRGAKDAVVDVTHELNFGRYTYIVEADIKGFFDNIDQKWLIKMLKLRIDDRVIIRLIEKWLRAGVLDTNNMVLHPLTGTPQGGVISPLLANIYLHYSLDLWFEKVVKKHCEGESYLCRYADDFICAFRFIRDAKKFFGTLKKRLGKFGLELAEEKTRIIKFNRHHIKNGRRFDFLGFEFYWDRDRLGKPNVKKRTSRFKLRSGLKNFKIWCKESRNFRFKKLFLLLNAKLRGYYNYYGVIGNFESLQEFFFRAMGILYKWLNRRSQRRSFNFKTFYEILKYYNIERPRITQRRNSQLKLT
jgi:group II intron reverse transcriptase/maturase